MVTWIRDGCRARVATTTRRACGCAPAGRLEKCPSMNYMCWDSTATPICGCVATPALSRGKREMRHWAESYVLVNSEVDKILYHAPFVTFRAGPFLDTGKVYDPSGYFGSPRWMWDAGVQLRIRYWVRSNLCSDTGRTCGRAGIRSLTPWHPEKFLVCDIRRVVTGKTARASCSLPFVAGKGTIQ